MRLASRAGVRGLGVGSAAPVGPTTSAVRQHDVMSDPLEVMTWPVELVREKDVSDGIVSSGFVSENDRKHLYHAAALLLFPSFNEGFGLPALEAFACATPVVTSRTRTDHSEAGGQDTPDQERPA